MKRGNVSVFIPHNGCPHQCSFCNQKNITGQVRQPGADDVRRVIENALSHLGDTSAQTEIAFFGGSFTAIDRDYMISLLEAAKPYTDRFYGIRVSTRPDYIDADILDVLKAYRVTSVELGAQSMDNSVLELNNRGHSAADIIRASDLIKKTGLSLGLQMMTGLYGSTCEKDIDTAERFIDIRPDTVRIYPTVIMKDTDLADFYLKGKYIPYSLETSVELCSKLILMFAKADISIIRLGLHYSDSLMKNSLGNNYHPAFKELCENKIFYDKFLEQAKASSQSTFTVYIHSKSLSKFVGQKKSNLRKLKELGYDVEIKFDDTLDKYDLKLNELGVCNAIKIT